MDAKYKGFTVSTNNFYRTVTTSDDKTVQCGILLLNISTHFLIATDVCVCVKKEGGIYVTSENMAGHSHIMLFGTTYEEAINKTALKIRKQQMYTCRMNLEIL